MCALVLLGIAIAKKYYGSLNETIDPRIVEARELYNKYNNYAQRDQIDSVFMLLDLMEEIYNKEPHYTHSYELGVLNNNRAAAYLTLALYSPVYSADSVMVDSFIHQAKYYSQESIEIYQNWLDVYSSLSEPDIQNNIQADFIHGLEELSSKEQARILNRRIKEIQEAQAETPRRLSVSYTNLGIIYRHNENYEKAAEAYTTALDLWDQNLTAKNNLNILLGRPLEKRTLIQKLFPPEK